MAFETEIELLRKCRQGDPDAWDEVFKRHYTATARFISTLGDFSVEDLEEICQETFLSVIRNLKSFAGNSQLQTWIFRIAANKSRDFREKQTAAKRGGGRAPLSLQAEDAEGNRVLDPVSPLPGPDTELLRAEQMQMVRDALNELGEPCREIIELRYFGDLSYDEISTALDMNMKTVSSRLSKCLDQLEAIARRIFSEGAERGFPSKLPRT